MGLTIIVTDDATGESETVQVQAGDYFLVCTEPAHLADVQCYPMQGTHVLTIKALTNGLDHTPRPRN